MEDNETSNDLIEKVVAPKQVDEDLSQEIIRTVVRGPREQVTCRRVSQNHYRCNWWMPETTNGYDNPAMSGMMVTTNRICQSHFMRVTRAEKGLKITVINN